MEYRSDYIEYQCESYSYYSLHIDPDIITGMYSDSNSECDSECIASSNSD